jgi:outer membrane protein assembly factor BamB
MNIADSLRQFAFNKFRIDLISGSIRTVLASIVLCGLSYELSIAGDWPQILGPDRNGIAHDETLAEKWPAGGPKKVWSEKVGSGIAGVAVAGDVAVLFHRENDEDKLTAFNGIRGEPMWTTGFPTAYRSEMLDDNGPRAVPTIHGDAIYAYSATGKLYCVDLKSGDKRWERKTHQDFGADGGYFGAGSSPVVEGKFVIVNVGGGKKKAGIVAFHLDSGETAWTSVSDQASYSSPTVVTVDGTRHLLCVTRLNFVSLDPLTGQERFRTRFGKSGPTVSAAIPVIFDKHVLLTASYGIGAQLLEMSADKADVVWSDDILSSQYTTPIFHDGVMFGIDGRQDGGAVALKCVDPKTRHEFWSKSGVGYSTLIAADGKLLMMQTDGVLKMIRLSKDRYEELATAKLLSGTTRALPALSRGRFYIKNEKNVLCVNLAKE